MSKKYTDKTYIKHRDGLIDVTHYMNQKAYEGYKITSGFHTQMELDSYLDEPYNPDYL